MNLGRSRPPYTLPRQNNLVVSSQSELPGSEGRLTCIRAGAMVKTHSSQARWHTHEFCSATLAALFGGLLRYDYRNAA